MDRIGRWVGRLEMEYRRARISQLRRMAGYANRIGDGWSIMASLPWAARKADRYARFAAACLAEIARLQGEGA
jgi:hypothetical protein